jgi:hypothetical protein
MQTISYRRLQFPPEIIRHAVWLYLRFTLSYRDVEELLAERGLQRLLRDNPTKLDSRGELQPGATSTPLASAASTAVRQAGAAEVDRDARPASRCGEERSSACVQSLG